MHKSLRTEVCLVLRRFKVPADNVSRSTRLHIWNVLDYLLALLNNCCAVLLLILEELKQGVGRHFPRRLLGVARKELVNLRSLQKAVIEGNELIFIQGLKKLSFLRITLNHEIQFFLSHLFPYISLFCVCLIELCFHLLFADLDVEQLEIENDNYAQLEHQRDPP